MMHNKFVKMAAAGAALTLVLAACGPKKEAANAPTSAPSAPSSQVLATVNGKDITVDDFKAEASTLSPLAVNALGEMKNKEKFLDNLVDKQLIVQEAEKMGLDKDPEVVKRLNLVKSNLMLGMLVKKEVMDKSNVSDQDVKAYFEQHKDDLGSVRLSHILVSSQKEAEDVLAKLKAGESFAKLAKEYSLDTKTKANGGDLGYVKWAQFGSPGLKEAAFKLKPGEVSGIVQSQFGFHIMKVTEKKPAAEADFEGMKDALKDYLLEQKKEDLFQALVKGLKDKAKITENKENLASIMMGPTSGLAGAALP